MKHTKEHGNHIDNDPIRQGRGAKPGFGWQGAASMVLGPNLPSSRRHATVVLVALGDPSVVGSDI